MSFAFGSMTTTTNANPFTFGAKTTASISFSNPASTSSTGFNFGLTKTTASTGLLATPASTALPSAGSFGFGTGSSLLGTVLPPPTTSTISSGFAGFGQSVKTTAATTTTASLGFNTGLGTGLLGSVPPATSTGLGGGLFGTPLTNSSTAGSSIFNSQPPKTATVGLGGVDPNSGLKSGTSGSSGSSSDGRTLKESILPEQLTATVDALQKYVKEEKAVREDIARMSSKPMSKVQEDVMALKQLLSVVANGLQRNTCSVEKLKQEMTQSLKNAEMAQRTKDLPAGLQYENTAPTEYFQRLVKEFEDSMVMYRQQIETLDNHLAALHHPSPHSPAEVLSLMKKLHETFLSLAAQLQQVHDAVKVQKDQFLTYRRVFHGDNKDIFQKTAVTQKPVRRKHLSDLAGPSPFPGASNAATQAMAMVLNRSQQPQVGPPATGLLGVGQLGTNPFPGGGLFSANKPLTGFGTTQSGGIGGSGSLFSSTFGPPPVGGFGPTPTLGSSTAAALNLAGINLNMSAAPKQPFQLQKPPPGAKRGKR